MSKSNTVQIAQYNKNGELLAKYASLSEAAYWTSTQVAHIGKVANGKRKTAGGFGWKHTNTIETLTNNTKGIRQTDEAGNTIAVYSTPEFAASMTEVSAKRIMAAVSSKRKLAGYLWS